MPGVHDDVLNALSVWSTDTPSIAELAAYCGCCPRTIRYKLSALERSGHITRVARPGLPNQFIVDTAPPLQVLRLKGLREVRHYPAASLSHALDQPLQQPPSSTATDPCNHPCNDPCNHPCNWPNASTPPHPPVRSRSFCTSSLRSDVQVAGAISGNDDESAQTSTSPKAKSPRRRSSAAKASRAARLPRPPSPARQFVEHFAALYGMFIGRRYLIAWHRDLAIAKRLLDAYGDETARQLAHLMFIKARVNPYFAKSAKDLRALSYLANQLSTTLSNLTAHGYTVADIDAETAWRVPHAG